MSLVQVDLIYPLPEGWGFCLTCEAMLATARMDEGPFARGLDEYPPEWQAEFQQLSAIILAIASRYPTDVQFRIWDPRSLQGLWKALRYGVRRYPTFIIAGSRKVTGWDTAQLEQALQSAGARPLA